MQITLAEALLRRKELAAKVEVLKQGIDDIVAQVPKLTASQVTAEFDWHARQLRLVDAAIQQTNWTTGVEVDASVMSDYAQPTQN